jgi:hypothetical protein
LVAAHQRSPIASWADSGCSQAGQSAAAATGLFTTVADAEFMVSP